MCLDFMSVRLFTYNAVRDCDKNLSKGLGNKNQKGKVAKAKDTKAE